MAAGAARAQRHQQLALQQVGEGCGLAAGRGAMPGPAVDQQVPNRAVVWPAAAARCS